MGRAKFNIFSNRFVLLWSPTHLRLLLGLLTVVGTALVVFSPIERAVNRFEVTDIGSNFSAALALTDRNPSVIELEFETLARIPIVPVEFFSGVGLDVAWHVRSAGGLRLVLDGHDLLIGSKDVWVRIGSWVPHTKFQLSIHSDGSATLREHLSPDVRGRINAGGIPKHEVTGIHLREAGLVRWHKVSVISSPSEDQRPSDWMLFGYLIVLSSVVSMIVPGLRRFRIPTRGWIKSKLGSLRQSWWIITGVTTAVLLVPASHTESWVVRDLNSMSWVRLYDLGEYVASPLGGLFYWVLSGWVKLVNPIWMTRTPIAVLFVVSVALFSRRFIVNRAGRPISRYESIQSILVILISVLAQGEWLRPEIPVLSLWMLSMAVLAGIDTKLPLPNWKLLIVGLMTGLLLHHSLGVTAALSIIAFASRQIRDVLRLKLQRSELFLAAAASGCVAVVAAIFGHNFFSFLEAAQKFSANSPVHQERNPLSLIWARVLDLGGTSILYRFSVSLLIASSCVWVVSRFQNKQLNSEHRIRLVLTLIMSSSVLTPAGPWSQYFVYTAPLTVFFLLGISPDPEGKRQRRWFQSFTLAVGWLVTMLLFGVVEPVGDRLTPALSAVLLLFVLLSPGQGKNSMLSLVLIVGMLAKIGSPLMATRSIVSGGSIQTVHHTVVRKCEADQAIAGENSFSFACMLLQLVAAKESDLSSTISTSAGGKYKPISFSQNRIFGFGEDCGFGSRLNQQNQRGSSNEFEIVAAYGYAGFSPCNLSSNSKFGIEAFSPNVHFRKSDNLAFGRINAPLLESRSHALKLVCLDSGGIAERDMLIELYLESELPNCLAKLQLHEILEPISVTWTRD